MKKLILPILALTALGVHAQDETVTACNDYTSPGWYTIQGASTHASNTVKNKWIVNAEKEKRQNQSASYNLQIDLEGNLHSGAKSFIYVSNVSGTNYSFRSLNGHYVTYQGKAQRTSANVNINAAFRIGDWSNYDYDSRQNSSEFEGTSYIGGSNGTVNAYAIKPADVSSFDIWTVAINAPNASMSIDDARVTLANDANQGIATVYNNGTYFLTAGATITADQITVTGLRLYDLTVNADNKTISVTDKSIPAAFTDFDSKVDAITGTAPGNITEETANDLKTKYQTLQNATTSTEFDTALDALKTALNSADKVAVSKGSFIRIFSTGTNGWAYGMTDAASVFVQNNNLNNIWYYDNDGYLVNYEKGCAVSQASSTLGSKTSAANHANGVISNATQIQFKNAQVNQTDFALGRFIVEGASTRILHNNGSSATVGSGSFTGVDQYAFSPYAPWTFKVETVGELPVTIHADGYGSIVSPVALTAPEGTYVARIDGDMMKFDAIDAGEVIPAGAHAFVKGTAGTTVNVAVAAGSDATNSYAHDKFTGSHLVREITPAEGDTLYAKVEVPATAPAALNLPDAQPIKLVALAVDATTGKATVPAGASVVSLPASLADAAGVLSIDPQTGVSTTAITEVSAKAESSDARYDLQGRRVNAAAKGLLISNGKKTIVR